MFSRETCIALFNKTAAPIGRLAALDDVPVIVATKKGAGAGQYTSEGEGAAKVLTLSAKTSENESVVLSTASGRSVKCAPTSMLCLAGGGYCYAGEAEGCIADTEAGPDEVKKVTRFKNEFHLELVEIRLWTIHAVLANGIWFLTGAEPDLTQLLEPS